PEIPRAVLSLCGTGNGSLGKPFRRILNSPKFKRFRQLPKIGWMNTSQGATHLARRPVAGSRSHGYTQQGISSIGFFINDEGNYTPEPGRSLGELQTEVGFAEMHKGEYPSLEATLANIE